MNIDLESEDVISSKYYKEAKTQDMTRESTTKGIKSSKVHGIPVRHI